MYPSGSIYLAPMEGILDSHMRALFTRIGGYSHCVTEFIRVIDKRLPRHLFYRHCPELRQGGRTVAGVPVTVQLLGSEPEMMAINAARAAQLGALSIDINFGCPSPTVNRHAGGAILLQDTMRLHHIVQAVRQAVPADIPVSAKMRLGYTHTEFALENAQAIQAAGASQLTVHARTKVDGYTYPARWEWLAKLKDILHIPLIANGDINSVADYQRCYALTGCEHIMLGRGALACPDLARQIQAAQYQQTITAMPWIELLPQLLQLGRTLQQHDTSNGRFVGSRLKQWLNFLQRHYSEAGPLLQHLRPISDDELVLAYLHNKIEHAF